MAAVALSGCGTLYKLEINATNPDHSGLEGAYVLVPRNPDITITSPQFQRYSTQVERALAGTGLTRLPIDRVADADMALLLDYWVSEPESVGYSSTTPMFQRRSMPDWEAGVKEGGANRTTGTGGSASPGVVDEPPVDDLVGTRTTTFSRTVYWREFLLQAVTFELQGPAQSTLHTTGRLWSVLVSTQGSSPDLDEVMPAMISAAQPHIGAHSDEIIREKMNGTSRRIRAIRGDD